MILARWTYTKTEWMAFKKHRQEKTNLWNGLLAHWRSVFPGKTPEVRITPDQVWIGNRAWGINNPQFRLRAVELREVEKINLLEITVENRNDRSAVKSIRVPVPKGKLREAFSVHNNFQGRIMLKTERPVPPHPSP